MSEPNRHHYLPKFYVSRWSGNDGKVCRFSRPNGVLVAERVVPKATGFEFGLYKADGVPPEQAQSMERDYLSKLDTAAAEALQMLERGLASSQWPTRARYNWSRFLLAQMLRSPEDIAQMKSSVAEAWSNAVPELEARYLALNPQADPSVVKREIERRMDEFALGIVRSLMDHPAVCETISNMLWLVLEVPEGGPSLLTSDRPVWRTTTLLEDDAMIIMPLGPRRLFTAVNDRSTQLRLAAGPRRDLVTTVNTLIVEHAVKYVYGDTGAMRDFVSANMSTKRHSSLAELLAVERGHRIVSPESPSAEGG